MFDLNFKGTGAVVPSDWKDVTTPLGKATQIYARALMANGIKDIELTFEQSGKIVTIPVAELVGTSHT